MADLPRFDPGLLQGLVHPLLKDLAARRARGGRAPVVALNGPVGAGKTSLARLLEQLAPQRGFRLAVVSIDDLYLPWQERRAVLEGNPYGVGRVPPGSHDVPLLLEALERWRHGSVLRLPRFDKTLAGGQGDRAGWWEGPADAVLVEGWLMGCRALGAPLQARWLERVSMQPPFTPAERRWLPRWDQLLAGYSPLWSACDGLWLLRPLDWTLPRRWRFQAEARQRRAGGGWLGGAELDCVVAASLRSLPPALYQDPLLPGWQAPADLELPQDMKFQPLPLLGGVLLDGRRRARSLPGAQPSPSSSCSSIG